MQDLLQTKQRLTEKIENVLNEQSTMRSDFTNLIEELKKENEVVYIIIFMCITIQVGS